jgi:hypothetical protein
MFDLLASQGKACSVVSRSQVSSYLRHEVR